VRGAVGLARKFKVSPIIVGVTILGFGTSAPELVISVHAALSGSPGIAVGNVVGSNIANILLILGTAALVSPIAVSSVSLRRDGSALAVASLLCLAVVLSGSLNAVIGAVFLIVLAAYLSLTILLEKRFSKTAKRVFATKTKTVNQKSASGLGCVISLIIGLAATIVGAKFMVEGAVSIATALGVSEAVIGLTIVSVGTSLPELVTSMTAARKGHGGIIFGNVLGSNMFNILGVLGVTAIIHPIRIPEEIMRFDIWLMTAATVVLLITARTGRVIGRKEGAILAVGYVFYSAFLLKAL